MDRMLEDPRTWCDDAVNLEGEVVEIKVGSELRSFLVHSTVLGDKSAFFKAALSKRWMTNKKSPIEMPEDDPDLFHHYLRYLYSHRIFTRHALHEIDDVEDQQKKNEEEWHLLFQLYILGEKLQDEYFMQRLVTSMLAKARGEGFCLGECDYEEINLLFQSTAVNSPARRLIIDMIAWSSNFKLAQTADATWYEAAFLSELTDVLLEKRHKLPYERMPSGLDSLWYWNNSGYASIDTKLYRSYSPDALSGGGGWSPKYRCSDCQRLVT